MLIIVLLCWFRPNRHNDGPGVRLGSRLRRGRACPGRGYQGGDAGFKGGEPGFKGGGPGLGGFLASAGVGGEFLGGVELLAADEVEALDEVVEAGFHHRLGFFAQAGEGGNGAAGDAGDVVEEFLAGRSCVGVLLVDGSSAPQRRL